MKLKQQEETTSLFVRDLKLSVKKMLEKLKSDGRYRTYADLLEAMAKAIKG